MTFNQDTSAFVATPQATVGLTLLPIIAFVVMCLAPVLLIFAFNTKGLGVTLKELVLNRHGALPVAIIVCCAFLNMSNWILVPGAFVHAFYTTLAMLLSLQFQMARDSASFVVSSRTAVWELMVLSVQVLSLFFNVGGAAGLSFLFGGGAPTALLAIWGPVDCDFMVQGPQAAISGWCNNGWYAIMILVSTAIIFLQMACLLVYINASTTAKLDTVKVMDDVTSPETGVKEFAP